MIKWDITNKRHSWFIQRSKVDRKNSCKNMKLKQTKMLKNTSLYIRNEIAQSYVLTPYICHLGILLAFQ